MEHTGYLDIHSHILPEIDDGSKDWNMTEQMLRMQYKQGIRTVIATPHNYPGRGTDKRVIDELCKKADELAKTIDDTMCVLPGNEIYYRNGILHGLEEEQILPLANSRYLLVEFHPSSYHTEIIQGLRELMEHGYIPIVAHVERVPVLFENDRWMDEALEMGCCFQCNCEDLLGGYFNRVTRRLEKLIAHGKIHFLGSDCHNVTERAPLMEDAIQRLRRHLDGDCVDKLVWNNPEKFLKNEYL